MLTLAYHDSQFARQITYSSCSNPDVQELTSVFEQISETLEFGRRLSYLHQHDKGALTAELDKMRSGGERHKLRELQALAATLSSIVSDHNVDKPARESAEELLIQARERR